MYSWKHQEEATDGRSEKELTIQVHMVSDNSPAAKSKYEEIKEETAKYLMLMKVTQCIIRKMALTEKKVQLMK